MREVGILVMAAILCSVIGWVLALMCYYCGLATWHLSRATWRFVKYAYTTFITKIKSPNIDWTK